MKASVCITAYNHGPYIRKCVESVLNQRTSFEYEILIGEDDSSDNTRSIVQSLAQEHPGSIRVFLHNAADKFTVNGKPTGRKNYANNIRSAKGTYVAVLDGDDYWLDPLKLQKQVDYLESHPDYGLVHGDYDVLYEDSQLVVPSLHRSRDENVPTGKVYQQLLVQNFIGTCTVCARRDFVLSFVESDLFFRPFLFIDFAVWLWIASVAKVGYINESLAVRRVLPESASKSHDFGQKFAFLLSGYDIRFAYMDRFDCPEALRSEVERNYHRVQLQYASFLMMHETAEEAFRALRRDQSLAANVSGFLRVAASKYKAVNFLFYWFRRVRMNSIADKAIRKTRGSVSREDH